MSKITLTLILVAIATVIAGIIINNQQKQEGLPTNTEEPIGSDFVETATNSGVSALELTYEHTAPGEYSQIFASYLTTPGAEVTMTLTGPEGTDPFVKTATANPDGSIAIPFKIYQYGHYDIRVDTDLERGVHFSGILVE